MHSPLSIYVDKFVCLSLSMYIYICVFISVYTRMSISTYVDKRMLAKGGVPALMYTGEREGYLGEGGRD